MANEELPVAELAPQPKHVAFGEKFAYLAISSTIMYTFALINIMQYM